jgi:hypothetical protein
MRKKLEQQQGLLDTPAEATESDFLESIARTIFRKGGGLLGELVNPTETGLDEGYLDDQGRLVVTGSSLNLNDLEISPGMHGFQQILKRYLKD